MQPNPITVQETSAPAPEPDFGDDAAASHAPLQEARILAFRRDFAAPRDYELPAAGGGFAGRALRVNVPFASRSARGQLLYSASKRGLDVAGALTLILLALPLFALVAALVKATSRGPVLFRHKRIGRGGREFWCFKFRTMSADAEERLKRDARLRQQFEAEYKLRHDPRVTPVGRFLRRSSLDELPQLWQVLRGEMSLVGPRPGVAPELAKYSIYANKLLTVKPGLSGMWQVCGRSDTTYPQRVMMDMHYIDHRSLALDAKLLLLTVSAVLRKSGAC
ncbi:MAG TPA: sugar transferase [Pyrinomonadaceae bacterium]|nr:sugar transferase [Pyrinomonadaceae bacterium]